VESFIIKNNFVIGIFDSGLGGLTVVKEIKKLLPNSSIVYLGDTARVPYGTRSPETIRKFAIEDTKFLLSKKVDMIIVACNTVSAVALDIVKETSSVPVYDVISPAIKKANKITKTGKIGLVGTRATVSSSAYDKVFLRKHASMLVPLIEEGFIKGPEINLFLAKYFKKFINNVDTLILGCTHYPLIKNEIQKFIGPSVILVDPAEEIAKVVYKFIQKQSIYFKKPRNDFYYLTDVNKRFMDTAKMFLGYDISDKIKKIEI
jgi:glutamate racemase